MRSADCSCSFSRSRTPSPRSEGAPAVVCLVALYLVIAAAPALAQSAKPDTLHHRPKPFTVMLRSAVVPGWGQVTNHKYVKAVGVVGVEGLLVYSALRELNRENEAIRRQDAVLAGGGDITDPVYVQAQLDQNTHRNKKINWIWWGIGAHFLSMLDAYVDAHLSSFDTDFGPPQSAVDVGEHPRLTVAYRTRF